MVLFVNFCFVFPPPPPPFLVVSFKSSAYISAPNLLPPTLTQVYLEFVVAKHVPPETAVRVYRRYLKTHAEKTEDYVAYLQVGDRW